MSAAKRKLIEEFDRIPQDRSAIAEKLQELREQVRTLNEVNGPKIEKLQAKADPIAAKMREAFAASQEAYQSGDGESAKSLSLIGKDYRAQCEAINVEANALRSELQKLYDQIKQLQSQEVKLSKRRSALREKLKAQQTVKYFVPRGGLVTPADFERMLANLPDQLSENIVTISVEVTGMRKDGLPMGLARDIGEGKWEITLYVNPVLHELTRDELLNSFRGTLIHEAAHGLYRKDPKLILEWGSIHNSDQMKNGPFITERAGKGPSEDFCECVRIFFTDQSRLKQYDPQRYELVAEATK